MFFYLNKKEVLFYILTNLKWNWKESGTREDGKPYAITDSETAADALTEILHDLGFDEESEPGVNFPDYRRTESTITGTWLAKFEEI